MKIAAAVLLLATATAPATARADDAPSVDQVMELLGELADPDVPVANAATPAMAMASEIAVAARRRRP